MQEHPWHHFWTRRVDAATGLGGSAESMSALTLKWWHQSVESGQIWARWWMNTWLSAGWPSHGGAGQAPAAWLPRRMDLPLGPETQERGPSDAAAGQAGIETASPSQALHKTDTALPPAQASAAVPATATPRPAARVPAGKPPAGRAVTGEGRPSARRGQAKP